MPTAATAMSQAASTAIGAILRRDGLEFCMGGDYGHAGSFALHASQGADDLHHLAEATGAAVDVDHGERVQGERLTGEMGWADACPAHSNTIPRMTVRIRNPITQ